MNAEITNLLGEELSEIHAANPLEVIRRSEEGLTKKALLKVGDALSLSQKELASLLPVSLRTFQRYKISETLDPVVSENIIRLVDIIRTGLEVFEDRNKFLAWMKRPNRALGGKKPIDIIKFRTGTELIYNLIGQIRYGIVA